MTEPAPEAPQAPIAYRPIKGQPSIYPSRALRAGRAPSNAPGPDGNGGEQPAPAAAAPVSKAPLVEWHAMTGPERVRNWSALRDWVTWLHDRYELSTEDRLPHCWVAHPGLIEELWALMIWRQEIYTHGQPGTQGQAARYWHTEMRNLIAAASGFYAAGCRTGHRSADTIAADATALLESWARADVTIGIPQQALNGKPGDTSLRIAEETMAAAIASGRAKPLSASIPEYVNYDGTWWIVDGTGGWIRVLDEGFAATLDESAAKMAQAAAAARRSKHLRASTEDSPTPTGQQEPRD